MNEAASAPAAPQEPIPQPSAPQQPAPEAKKPARPVRRVGSFTTGLTLIAAGVLLCVWLIHPGAYLYSVLRFSPLILVLLGAEILVSCTVFRGERMKYDFLSIVLCFVLLLTAGIGAAAAAAGQYWSASLEQPKQLDALRMESAASLQDVNVEGLEVYSIGGWPEEFLVPYTQQELKQSARLHITVHLAGPYGSDEAFARDALRSAQALSRAGIQPGSLLITAPGPEDAAYEVELDGLFLDGLTVQELTRRMAPDAPEDE